MDSVFFLATVICFIFLICKFIEMRFISKENKSLKTMIIDSGYVYFSIIIGYFIIDQFSNTKGNIITGGATQVFTDVPGF